MRRRTWKALIGVAAWVPALAALAGADLSLDIRLEQPGAEPTDGPAVAVDFIDGRDAGDGGGDPTSLGLLKSSDPRRVVHASGLGIADVVRASAAAALADAGFDARPEEDAGHPRLTVTLQEISARGLTRCKVPVQLRLELVPAGATAPSWAETVTVKGEVTLASGPEDLAAGYEDAMARARREMGERFEGGAFARVVAPVRAGGAESEPVRRTAESEPVRRTAEPETEAQSETGAGSEDTGSQLPVDLQPAAVIRIDEITDPTEKAATAQLADLCLTHFRIEFTFLGEDDSSEWTVTLVDEDDDDVGYVNLDDEETIEFDGDDEDLDDEADAGESHRAVIEVDDDEVTVWIGDEEVLDDEDLDSYDECLHLEIKVDDDMTLTDFVVTPM